MSDEGFIGPGHEDPTAAGPEGARKEVQISFSNDGTPSGPAGSLFQHAQRDENNPVAGRLNLCICNVTVGAGDDVVNNLLIRNLDGAENDLHVELWISDSDGSNSMDAHVVKAMADVEYAGTTITSDELEDLEPVVEGSDLTVGLSGNIQSTAGGTFSVTMIAYLF